MPGLLQVFLRVKLGFCDLVYPNNLIYFAQNEIKRLLTF